jgi:hypothetical protein
MSAARSYIPPAEIGEVMRALAAGRVIASRHPGFAPGDWVHGRFGVQEHAVSDGQNACKIEVTGRLVPPRPEPPGDLDLDDERRSLFLLWERPRPRPWPARPVPRPRSAESRRGPGQACSERAAAGSQGSTVALLAPPPALLQPPH